jgi:predicted transcriptional regulator
MMGELNDEGDDSGQRDQTIDPDLVSLTVQIVEAYVYQNTVPHEALPRLIQSVHTALIGLASLKSEDANRSTPAVPIKQSVFPDYIVCLEDGKQLRSLKRHLQMSFGLTPDEYRKRWGLPPTYPMVAPNYAAKRSMLAKRHGLGRNPADRDAGG